MIKSLINRVKNVWRKLNPRQRRALKLMGIANLVILVLLAILLLLPPPSTAPHSPLPPPRLETCRQSVSRALLARNSSGLIQAWADGTILVRLERPLTHPDLRRDADAAIWLAFEALAAAGREACHGFQAAHVTVILSVDGAGSVQATAQVSLPDLLAWSLGQIDDAELARRLHYHLPTTPDPTPTSTIFPVGFIVAP